MAAFDGRLRGRRARCVHGVVDVGHDVVGGFDSISPTATLAAGLGAIALVVALVLLGGRRRGSAIAVGVLGVFTVALAIDLFARNAGGSLFGDALDWQGSDAEGISSLVPAWGLVAIGIALFAVATWAWQRSRRPA